MNVLKPPPPPSSPRLWMGLGLAAALAIVLGVYWYWPTPQIGPDENVMRTVDALFTAVTGRSEKGLTQCEKRLSADREAGKLPAAAGDVLDAVIRQARAGDWEASATRLYAFIRAQERDITAEKAQRKKGV
jgi:hypothetical protein